MNPTPARECPNGHPVTDQTADYCATCGTALQARCPNGHLVDPTHDYCDQCGASLASIEPERGTAASTAPPIRTVATAQAASSGMPRMSRADDSQRSPKRALLIAGVIVLVLAVAGGAFALTQRSGGSGTERAHAVPSSNSTPSTPTTAVASTTAPATSGAVAGGSNLRQLSVVACPTLYGTSNHSEASVPTNVTATLTDGEANELAAYSNGHMSVLAPSGWTCNALNAGDGTWSLRVTPPGQPTQIGAEPGPDARGIVLIVDSTDHNPGRELACNLFPDTSAATQYQNSIGCPSYPDETTTHPDTDVVRFSDAPNTAGSGDLSGGTASSEGAVVYRLEQSIGSVNIAKISCTLDETALCAPIVDDFLARGYPTA